jgi:hypothetical protein
MTVATGIFRGQGRDPRMGCDPLGSRWMEWRYIASQRNVIPCDGTGSVMSPNPLAVAYT